MFVIGKLADGELAKDIGKQLNEKAIVNEIRFDYQEKQYLVLVANEKDVEEAFNCYRVMIGGSPVVELSGEWKYIKSVPLGRVTMVLVIVSVVLFILFKWENTTVVYEYLLFATRMDSSFVDILSGQWWRLFTPCFLHFGFFHILFNMMWLKDLGSLVEFELGRWFLISFILLVGIGSNIAQYLYAGPLFGGMSGVVYGFLGLLWMNKKFNPAVKYSLPRNDVILMLGWLVLCALGLIGNIANMAHAIGLACGMAIGIVIGIRGRKVNR